MFTYDSENRFMFTYGSISVANIVNDSQEKYKCGIK